MSSIALTVTSGIVHLRRREKTFAEVQLDRAPKLTAGSVASRTGRPNGPGVPGSLQRRLEEHAARAAVWPWPARLTHTDVRIGGWLVEPRGRDSLLAPAAQERDQPLETVGLPTARLVHRFDPSRRSLRARPLQLRVRSGMKCCSSPLVLRGASRCLAVIGRPAS